MNFEEFLKFKKEILTYNKDILNLAENNLYEYFPSKIQYDGSGHINNIVYRCHLVEDWLRYYNLDSTLKTHIGVSTGVRNSIEVLVDVFRKKTFVIPSDVYPFYQKTMKSNSIDFLEYRTLGVNELFDELKLIEADILLITDPLKPLGRDITLDEYNKVKTWLEVDSSRLLIVDGVYTLNNRLNPFLLTLYEESKQVILMYSLSKAWCLPNHFGVTLLPKNPFGLEIREKFKELPKDQNKLNLSYVALNRYIDYPEQLKKVLNNNLSELSSLLNIEITKPKDNIGYMFYIEKDYKELLKDNILVIPATVFGGFKGSIISTLITSINR